MRDVLSIILGGGQGTRLYPLTKLRAKPAVPLAGKYRLIDIPLSNSINSGIDKIYVLTQFNSASLNRHITQTYRPAPFSDGFVDVLAAQQTPENADWFQGTADAVRQYLWLFESWKVRDYLILSGDHLYRMDYRLFIDRHRETNADITLAVLPVDQKRASAFGLMKLDQNNRVIGFMEKPKGADLEKMRVDTSCLGLSPEEALQKPFIASMGIYVFRKEVLIETLRNNPDHVDFGKEVIPNAIDRYNLQTYLFNDYWEDIGTIDAFYHANINLTRYPDPPFKLYEDDAAIYTRPRYLPPTQIVDCQIKDSIVSDGCVIERSKISHSVLGLRLHVRDGCVIEDSLFMGCDFYQKKEEIAQELAEGKVPMGIGENSVIRRAIIDKNVRIGKNVQIINRDHIQDADCEERGFCIRGGIVIVLKNATIPDNTII
jgi:glucose-1-phosphate adenylyltransferase